MICSYFKDQDRPGQCENTDINIYKSRQIPGSKKRHQVSGFIFRCKEHKLNQYYFRKISKKEYLASQVIEI